MKKTFFGLCLVFSAAATQAATAVFAGGCFWCMEAAYQEVEGVSTVVSGFTGGTHPNPTYKGDHTGHYEAVLVTYDDTVLDYNDLLDIYWRNIDPFDGGGQFCDRGASYRAAIFTANEAEQAMAEASKAAVMQRFPKADVVTEILPRAKFFPVEEGHQDYYIKNPIRYKYYRYGCGRDRRLEEIWGSAE